MKRSENMIIIGNGRLVTREIGNSFYENGAVAADSEVIVKVGETEALKKDVYKRQPEWMPVSENRW